MSPSGQHKRRKLNAVCLTHIGMRSNQEDNYCFRGTYLTPDLRQRMAEIRMHCECGTDDAHMQYFAVSDGIGGHNAGETASLICVEKLASAKVEIEACPSVEAAAAVLEKTINDINQDVCRAGRENSTLHDMGATLVAAVVSGGRCAVLNIGDSRAYHIAGNSITKLTKDDTEGQFFLDRGLLTAGELANFPSRKNLRRYIGYGGEGFLIQAEEYYLDFEKGVLLLCSDGVTDSLPDRRILEIIKTAGNLESAGRRLIKKAVSSTNADNATAILISEEAY